MSFSPKGKLWVILIIKGQRKKFGFRDLIGPKQFDPGVLAREMFCLSVFPKLVSLNRTKVNGTWLLPASPVACGSGAGCGEVYLHVLGHGMRCSSPLPTSHIGSRSTITKQNRQKRDSSSKSWAQRGSEPLIIITSPIHTKGKVQTMKVSLILGWSGLNQSGLPKPCWQVLSRTYFPNIIISPHYYFPNNTGAQLVRGGSGFESLKL